MTSHQKPVAADTADDDSLDPAVVAKVVERLDNLWSDRRREASPFLSDAVGQQIGKYIIREVVGAGAFGVVYRATDEALGRDVAIKIPRPEVLMDADRLARFQNEAATTAMLDHPVIVPVYEANLTGPTPYLVSAYCKGPDLGQWLEGRTDPAKPENAAKFVGRLAEAVDFAHQKGILHRDLKPGNVLLDPLKADVLGAVLADFQPRLTDFGLAKIVAASLRDTRSSLVVGTPLYMAPEQFAGKEKLLTPATDVYALGVLLFELLTLHTPFEGDSYIEVFDKVRNEEPPKLQEFDKSIPSELVTICEKCLEKDSADRYGSAAELQDDLRRFLAGEAISARPLTLGDRFWRWCRQPQRIVTAGWFVWWNQLFVALWMWLTLLVGVQVGFLLGNATQAVIDIGLVTLTGNVPLMVLGRLAQRNRYWTLIPLICLSTGMLAALVHASSGEGMVFAYLYPTGHSKAAAYTMLIMFGVTQLGFCLIAIPAWWRWRQAVRS